MSDQNESGRRVYDVVLALLGGSALGWFGWWFLDGYGSGARLPLVVWAVVGTVLAYVTIGSLRSRSGSGRSRWVHLLWIPVALFVALMVSVVLALRNWQ